MIVHAEITEEHLRHLIRKSGIAFGGNARLKIFGKLSCTSGKRMKKVNRVFFKSFREALDHQYRPCGICMRKDYNHWKNESV